MFKDLQFELSLNVFGAARVKRTVTKRCNRLSPTHLEALQFLKAGYWRHRKKSLVMNMQPGKVICCPGLTLGSPRIVNSVLFFTFVLQLYDCSSYFHLFIITPHATLYGNGFCPREPEPQTDFWQKPNQFMNQAELARNTTSSYPHWKYIYEMKDRTCLMTPRDLASSLWASPFQRKEKHTFLTLCSFIGIRNLTVAFQKLPERCLECGS